MSSHFSLVVIINNANHCLTGGMMWCGVLWCGSEMKVKLAHTINELRGTITDLNTELSSHRNAETRQVLLPPLPQLLLLPSPLSTITQENNKINCRTIMTIILHYKCKMWWTELGAVFFDLAAGDPQRPTSPLRQADGRLGERRKQTRTGGMGQ
jgi:hypothetical protein